MMLRALAKRLNCTVTRAEGNSLVHAGRSLSTAAPSSLSKYVVTAGGGYPIAILPHGEFARIGALGWEFRRIHFLSLIIHRSSPLSQHGGVHGTRTTQVGTYGNLSICMMRRQAPAGGFGRHVCRHGMAKALKRRFISCLSLVLKAFFLVMNRFSPIYPFSHDTIILPFTPRAENMAEQTSIPSGGRRPLPDRHRGCRDAHQRGQTPGLPRKGLCSSL